jgi:hypothetical protein
MTGRIRIWTGMVIAALGGLFVGWVDESLRWSDDARVGFCLVIFSSASVFIARRKPLLLAILVAMWVPLLPPSQVLDWKPWLAFLPAIFSAYLTWLAINRSDLVL